MASPSENFLAWNSGVIPAQTGYNAEYSQQMQHGAEFPLRVPMQHGAGAEQQQSKRTIKSSRSSKRAKLATITLKEYMKVFNHLTDGKGKFVQPNCDIKLITAAQLKSVLRLHALPLKSTQKDSMLQSLVGVELWNPYMLPEGPVEPRNITDEEMLEALRVLEW